MVTKFLRIDEEIVQAIITLFERSGYLSDRNNYTPAELRLIKDLTILFPEIVTKYPWLKLENS